MMVEVASIQELFKSRYIHVSQAWLQSCINWCKQEILPSNYTSKDLQLKVFEQWLLLDLRDLELPCLPADLSQKQKYLLNGSYSLQLCHIVDISRSKYSQIQKFRNEIPKNIDTEADSTKRMLLLTLTDGVQEVSAMEYKSIQSLSLNITPGIKIKLIGPITVRRGRLMLENQNIKIIGGEVDDLIIPNAAENILARALNLPLNPNPKVIQESLLTADTTVLNDTTTPTNAVNQLRIPPISDQKNAHPNTITQEINNEEIEDEINLMMEIEREFEEASKVPRKTPDMFGEVDVNDCVFESLDIPVAVIKTPVKEDGKLNDQFSLSFKESNEVFDNFDDVLNVQIKSPTIQPVIWTIEKLTKNLPNINNGKFKIKAKFKAVVEKMTVVNDQYYLVIKVEDNTGEINVSFSCDVVTEVINYTASQFMQFKEVLIEKTDESCDAKVKILDSLKKLKDWLTKLDNVMEIRVVAKEKYPIVLRVL